MQRIHSAFDQRILYVLVSIFFDLKKRIPRVSMMFNLNSLDAGSVASSGRAMTISLISSHLLVISRCFD